MTSRRVSVIIACIFVILLVSVAPLYVVNRLGMKFFPEKNTTLLGLVPTADREMVDTISFAINNGLIPFGAFFVVIICTVMLMINLKSNTKWREKLSPAPQVTMVKSQPESGQNGCRCFRHFYFQFYPIEPYVYGNGVWTEIFRRWRIQESPSCYRWIVSSPGNHEFVGKYLHLL